MKMYFKTKKFRPNMFCILLMLSIVYVGILGGCSPNTSSQETSSVLEKTQAKVGGITLPSDAKKLSECVPNMGTHYANPKNMPFGPVYLVDKGKVVGLEYMIHEDELKKNIMTIPGPDGEEFKIGEPAIMPTLGVKYDHIELNYLPEGHPGDTDPHYDVHMYLISEEEQKKLCL